MSDFERDLEFLNGVNEPPEIRRVSSVLFERNFLQKFFDFHLLNTEQQGEVIQRWIMISGGSHRPVDVYSGTTLLYTVPALIDLEAYDSKDGEKLAEVLAESAAYAGKVGGESERLVRTLGASIVGASSERRDNWEDIFSRYIPRNTVTATQSVAHSMSAFIDANDIISESEYE
jgi:hypothetical protein